MPPCPVKLSIGACPSSKLSAARTGLGNALAVFFGLGCGILRALGGGFGLGCLLLCVLAGCSICGRLRCQLQRCGNTDSAASCA